MKEILTKATQTKAVMREGIVEFERRLDALPDSVKGKELDKLCPLKHTFVDGAYVREIFMPKGTILTSKIHKICHPYFVMQGDCSVLTDEGVVRIIAPHTGITQPGTKRILYMHEDTVWITVHVTKEQDLEKIEEEIIAKDFSEVFPISVEQFREMTIKMIKTEKDGFYSDWTFEEQKLFDAGKWKAFSRSRGYTEEEITEYEEWMRIIEFKPDRLQ